MLRALAALVGALLLVGIYSVVTGGATTQPTPGQGPGTTHFGFALAAGAIALAATLLLSRPRMRFRR